MPRTIVSDRDRLFVSQFWRELFKLQGTTLAFSSAYHPQTDGQAEVTNRILETYLRCFVSDNPKLWVSFLPLAEYWYDTSYQSAICMTPFEALYGRCPPAIKSYTVSTTAVTSLDELLQQRKQTLATLKDNLVKAQMRMRSLANAQRQDRKFYVGDWAWLKLAPYRQTSMHPHCSPKLTKKFYGPFQVMKVINRVAYELKLSVTTCIHPVFHVSKLKPFKGTPPTTIPELDPAVTGTLIELQPLAILGYISVQTALGDKLQVLIHWAGLTTQEATWEDKEDMQKRFPLFNLEDKVLFEDPGIDTSASANSKKDITVGSLRTKRMIKSPIWLKDYVTNKTSKE